MENQRLWQMSSKYKSLQKMTVSNLVDQDMPLHRSFENSERTRKFLSPASQEKITNRQVKYFKVDKTGLHCFILCSDAIFYANFASDTVHEVHL